MITYFRSASDNFLSYGSGTFWVAGTPSAVATALTLLTLLGVG